MSHTNGERYALVSNEKPPREVTQGLRRWGLRWMRSESAWVAYRNARGRHAIEQGAKLYSEWYESRAGVTVDGEGGEG